LTNDLISISLPISIFVYITSQVVIINYAPVISNYFWNFQREQLTQIKLLTYTIIKYIVNTPQLSGIRFPSNLKSRL